MKDNNAPRAKEVSAEKMTSGGWLLAVLHDGRRIHSRYFDYTLREAKQRFIADIRAGLL